MASSNFLEEYSRRRAEMRSAREGGDPIVILESIDRNMNQLVASLGELLTTTEEDDPTKLLGGVNDNTAVMAEHSARQTRAFGVFGLLALNGQPSQKNSVLGRLWALNDVLAKTASGFAHQLDEALKSKEQSSSGQAESRYVNTYAAKEGEVEATDKNTSEVRKGFKALGELNKKMLEQLKRIPSNRGSGGLLDSLLDNILDGKGKSGKRGRLRRGWDATSSRASKVGGFLKSKLPSFTLGGSAESVKGASSFWSRAGTKIAQFNPFSKVGAAAEAAGGVTKASSLLNVGSSALSKLAAPLAMATAPFAVAEVAKAEKEKGNNATGSGISGALVNAGTFGLGSLFGLNTMGDAAKGMANLASFGTLGTDPAESVKNFVDSGFNKTGEGIEWFLDKSGLGTAIGRSMNAMLALDPFTENGEDARRLLLADMTDMKDRAIESFSSMTSYMSDGWKSLTKRFTEWGTSTKETFQDLKTSAESMWQKAGTWAGDQASAVSGGASAGVDAWKQSRAGGGGLFGSLKAAAGAAVGSYNDILAKQTQQAITAGVKYGFGDKNAENGSVDCSGWIAQINGNMMSTLNEAASGKDVFSNDAKKALQGGASEIIDNVGRITGKVMTNKELSDPTKVKEGMMIGMDTGEKGWDKGRKRGVDHIVQTFKDPETGKMMVSESRGGKGAMKSDYQEWLDLQNKKGVKLYGVDPMAMANQEALAQAQKNLKGKPQVAAGAPTPAKMQQPKVTQGKVETIPPQIKQEVDVARRAPQQPMPAVQAPKAAASAKPQAPTKGRSPSLDSTPVRIDENGLALITLLGLG